MVSSLFKSFKVQEAVDKNNPDRSSFIFHDLPLQMGTALGNLLRQILLNHLSGIAPLAVEISDQKGPVKTEFSILTKVSENGTTPELILKLKEIIWVERQSAEQKKSLQKLFCCELKVENKSKKERVITAGDFQVGSEVEIKNSELKLATLSPEGELSIKLYCQKNWGYRGVKEKEKEEIKKLVKDCFPNVKEDNILVPDTDYSPLKGGQVSFQVEKDELQKKEKLTLSIQSRGWITPMEAFF